MIDPANVPPVAENELLARFICYSDEKRADGTVKHKLFLPYSRVELSVNRHREATLKKLGKWGVMLRPSAKGRCMGWQTSEQVAVE